MSEASPKPCPFCGKLPVWATISDARSAEFVGPWRVLACVEQGCGVKPRIQAHTDGKWVQGQGTPQDINRDPELLARWNHRS